MGMQRALEAIKTKLLLMIGRAVLTVIYNDEGTQKVQATGLADEILEKMERMEEYGMTTYPKAGAEMVPLFFGGNRHQGLVMVIHDRRYRPTDLAEGEVCLYTDEGKAIHLKRSQIIDLLGDILNAPEQSEINLGGARGALKKLMTEAMIDIFNNHTHPYTDDGAPLVTSATTTPLDAATHATDITRAK